MFSHSYSRIFILTILLVLNYSWFCMSLEESIIGVQLVNFLPAVATWYDKINEGKCGFEEEVASSPYNGMVAAGNNNLFRSGKGCGSCFLVKCTENPACSGHPIKVTITDEYPGAGNNKSIHFNLSHKALGSLAKNGLSERLRKFGRINIQYQRVGCSYKAFIRFKINKGSNQYYLAFAVISVNGDGDVDKLEILSSNTGAKWVNMQRSIGAIWKVDLPKGAHGPYSVRITKHAFHSPVVADKVIPANWAPGKSYDSKVNFFAFP